MSRLRHSGIACEAGAKQLVLFHGDPAHNSHEMAGIQAEARTELPSTVAAWEGLTAAL